MDTYITQLQLIRTQTLAMIAELTQSPKPTYSLDGQTVSWETYLKQLQNTVDWCNRQLQDADPTEIRTVAVT